MVGLVGIEPTTNRLWAECSNPWATGPNNKKKEVVQHLQFDVTSLPIHFTYHKENLNGGKTGIRTLGTEERFTPLAGEPIRPLWHLSIYFCFTKLIMAERQGFEPWVSCPTTVFKTVPFDHSGISPNVYIR